MPYMRAPGTVRQHLLLISLLSQPSPAPTSTQHANLPLAGPKNSRPQPRRCHSQDMHVATTDLRPLSTTSGGIIASDV
ncbi:hypothetical protein HBI56_035320 [Parastagonospora nodorum]|nr:hypothetical protein HBH56_071510 [Parastagonospora nodorum]KAH3932505.1 hypothetical protein HBH54_076620 [Parastagonospora nodorum]KAH4004691.1 hypothetical protein HBI10_038690 [Parastagonospora nodorum]KAH4030571.1 hypothetical protein HBI13_022140 [Parastagonospora nodorum]KAH4040699.1 hypothetical protein HBI09_031260 [Parastagonospora nodorum]